MRKLTPREEKFAQGVAGGLSQAEAYRQAYPSSAKWKDATVWNKASALMRRDEVLARVAELQAEHAKRHEITVDSLLDELEEARTVALGAINPQSSAAVAATMGKARLLGLDKQITELHGKGGGPIQQQLVTPEQLAEAVKNVRETF